MKNDPATLAALPPESYFFEAVTPHWQRKKMFHAEVDVYPTCEIEEAHYKGMEVEVRCFWQLRLKNAFSK